VKTSNPGGGDLQDLKLESGLRVYEHMADLTARWGAHYPGRHGYSKVCAVVGATYPEQGAALRARAPRTFFLAPGYGAQGASGKDLRGFFDKSKSGCIVNSSRGILAAWKKSGGKAGVFAREAALRMRQDLRDAGCC
jgi:orotidine-5'-phosphate decarboxylase